MTPTRVGIWGVYGRGNYGNEAALTAFLTNLDRDEFSPILLTEEPRIASAYHSVPARRVSRPVGQFRGGRVLHVLGKAWNRSAYLFHAWRTVGDLDAVVIAGSGGLERYGSGSFGTPFEVWSLGVSSRMRRRPFILLDIGVEYLPRRLARSFVRGAAACATYRSYRDEASRESMRETGARDTERDAVVTDMVFALDPELAPLREPYTVVVGVMDYWGRDREQDQHAVHNDYTERTVELARLLRAQGRHVRLLGGDDEDIAFARVVAERAGGDLPVVEARSPGELTREMSAAAVVVAARYHSLLMALLARTPAISIGYGRKHRAMLEQLSLGDTHRDIESFDPEDIADLVTQSIRLQNQVRAKIDAGVIAARRRLDAQWPDVSRAMSTRREESR